MTAPPWFVTSSPPSAGGKLLVSGFATGRQAMAFARTLVHLSAVIDASGDKPTFECPGVLVVHAGKRAADAAHDLMDDMRTARGIEPDTDEGVIGLHDDAEELLMQVCGWTDWDGDRVVPAT